MHQKVYTHKTVKKAEFMVSCDGVSRCVVFGVVCSCVVVWYSVLCDVSCCVMLYVVRCFVLCDVSCCAMFRVVRCCML